MVRSVWLRSDGRGEVSQVAVSSVEDWLVKAVEVRHAEVRSVEAWLGEAVIVWRGLVRRDQSGYGGRGAA